MEPTPASENRGTHDANTIRAETRYTLNECAGLKQGNEKRRSIFGWQAHIDHCGAFPPPPENRDEEIKTRLQATFAQKIKQYEYLHATHYVLLAKVGPNGMVEFERWEHHP